ncbi:MAG: DUF4143 domain-containing protein [bacterium]|nr:DUF4143 domain-containing protein [bacterium]
MSEFRRPQVATIVERLGEPPERLVAVFGPRQTGKTTAVRQALEIAGRPYRFEAVDDPGLPDPPRPGELHAEDLVRQPRRRDCGWLAEVWQDSRRRAWRSPQGLVLVLDEIQKIAGWSEVVKGLWDADRSEGCPLHVVILGSAPLLMQAGLTESLAGRFEPIRFTHWSYAEMAEAFGFDIERYVFFGGYPGAASRIDDFQRWSDYVRGALIEPNIERDVLAMTRVDKPALLRRLFYVGAAYSGQVVAYNKLVGQLQDAGNTTTLTRYLELLSQAGLLTGFSKHTERPVSAKASTPKLNVLNTALMAVVSGYTFEEAQLDRTFRGRLAESTVGAHLANTVSPSAAVRYWRDRHDEVDFVLVRGPQVVGVEVKSGSGSPAAAGIAEFERRFDPRRTVIVGDAGVPLHEFLSVPADHWFDAESV